MVFFIILLLGLNTGIALASASTTKNNDAMMNVDAPRVVPRMCQPLAFQSPHSRRNMIGNVAQSIVGAGVLSTTVPNSANAAGKVQDASSTIAAAEPFSVYQIMPDASAQLSPTIKPLEPTNFIQKSIFNRKDADTKGGVIWLGEHHNSARDHNLQAHFIENIYNQRMQASMSKRKPSRSGNHETPPPPSHKMSIGLEQIQVQFQPSLDAFVAGTISEEQMLEETQWNSRWSWPYVNYRPIFALAQTLKIPLIALNVNSEDLAKVEMDGFKGLPKSTIRKYIKDPVGFSNYSRPNDYRTYSAYVIEPSYDLHKEMGILKTTISGQVLENDMSFLNFFSGRILWDEAMAGNAFQWTKENEGGIMIGLIGADHVKFEKGVVGRYRRLMEYDASGSSSSSAVASSLMNVSVLLNPTLIDSRPSGSAGAYMNAASSAYPDRITLQLRYLKDEILPFSEDGGLPSSTGGVLPLADYIVISNSNTV